MVSVTFDRVEHFIRIPVDVSNKGTARFLVDTGIGVTVVSPTFATEHGLLERGTFTGQRMSGQPVTAPLTRLSEMRIAGLSIGDAPAVILDLGVTAGSDLFDGILGLDVLGHHPVTIDPFTSTLHLGSFAQPHAAAVRQVSVRLHRNGPAVDLRTDLRLPDGTVLEAEIDTGSDTTILDSRFMSACGVDGTEPDAQTVEGTDETGHRFVRRFIRISGALSLATAPETTHSQPQVMFQDIALGGLIGTDFLNRYTQTYDTRAETLTLTPMLPMRAKP